MTVEPLRLPAQSPASPPLEQQRKKDLALQGTLYQMILQVMLHNDRLVHTKQTVTRGILPNGRPAGYNPESQQGKAYKFEQRVLQRIMP